MPTLFKDLKNRVTEAQIFNFSIKLNGRLSHLMRLIDIFGKRKKDETTKVSNMIFPRDNQCSFKSFKQTPQATAWNYFTSYHKYEISINLYSNFSIECWVASRWFKPAQEYCYTISLLIFLLLIFSLNEIINIIWKY